jgi:hypothetical protein
MPPAATVVTLQNEHRHAQIPRPQQPSLPAARHEDDLDDALLKELEVSLDDKPVRSARPPVASLDDEMTKLLGELSSHKRMGNRE